MRIKSKTFQIKFFYLCFFICFLSSWAQAVGLGGGSVVPVKDDEVRQHTQKIQANTKKIEDYLKELKKYLGIQNKNGSEGGSGYQSDLGPGDGQGYVDLKGGKFGVYQSKANSLTKELDLELKTIHYGNAKGVNGSGSEDGTAGKIQDPILQFYGEQLSILCKNDVEVSGDKEEGVAKTAKNILKKQVNKQLKKEKDISKQANLTCNAARNMLAHQLQEIFNLTQLLEERNNLLQEYLSNAQYKSSAELAKHSFEIEVMQTLIQNDLLRLQAAVTAYDTKIKLFKQIQSEAQYEIIYGKKQDSFNFLNFASNLGKGVLGSGLDVGTNNIRHKIAKEAASSKNVNRLIKNISKKFHFVSHE